jgi:hypothetical protein
LRISRHAIGQHQRDGPVVGPVVADAVGGAEAMPQPVHDLILAQPGGLGDLRYSKPCAGSAADNPILRFNRR